MPGKYVRDPVHGEVFIPEDLVPIVDHPRMQRLRRVRQLALADLVYPSATHSRFSHSLGVYHITSHATTSLPVLAYAMVHDAGHGPFSHLIEYALKRNGHKFDHEEQLKRILPEILEDSVLTARDVLEAPENPIVTGGIGSDRLDYLRRDSYSAGIAVGEIAWDRIVRNVSIRDGKLLARYKILPNIEHIFVSRFILGDALYFHKTVLIANEMFVRAVSDLLQYYRPEEIVEMDDVQMISEMRRIGSKWWADIERRRLFEMVFKSGDRREAEEEYEKLAGKMGEENVVFGERAAWHKPPEIIMEDGKPVEEVSPLIASLRETDRRRHYYFVAVRR